MRCAPARRPAGACCMRHEGRRHQLPSDPDTAAGVTPPPAMIWIRPRAVSTSRAISVTPSGAAAAWPDVRMRVRPQLDRHLQCGERVGRCVEHPVQRHLHRPGIIAQPRQRVAVQPTIGQRRAYHHPGEARAANRGDIGPHRRDIVRCRDEPAVAGPHHRVAGQAARARSCDQPRSRCQPANCQSRTKLQPIGPRLGRGGHPVGAVDADFELQVPCPVLIIVGAIRQAFRTGVKRFPDAINAERWTTSSRLGNTARESGKVLIRKY